MANKHRGEVDIEVPSGTFTLRFSTNAICDLEDRLDLGIAQIVGRLEDEEQMRLGVLRSVVWAGLRDNHQGITEPQAGDVISEAGMGVIVAKISEALSLAFPESEGAAGGGEARPPKKRGTGQGS